MLLSTRVHVFVVVSLLRFDFVHFVMIFSASHLLKYFVTLLFCFMCCMSARSGHAVLQAYSVFTANDMTAQEKEEALAGQTRHQGQGQPQ
jgi:hypothetical protein